MQFFPFVLDWLTSQQSTKVFTGIPYKLVLEYFNPKEWKHELLNNIPKNNYEILKKPKTKPIFDTPHFQMTY